MRYPNTRYGNPAELQYYTQGLSVKQIAKQLKRSEKSIAEWLNGNRKIPFWVPELLRLRHMEADLRMRQMGFGEQKLKLGIVKNNTIQFQAPRDRSCVNRESALRTASVLPIPALGDCKAIKTV